MSEKTNRIEYGDYQTPQSLAEEVLGFLKSQGLKPAAIVEPTCGTGAFVRASSVFYPSADIFAFDVNCGYTSRLTEDCSGFQSRVQVKTQDFFDNDWKAFFNTLEGDILVVGNPPWVTNASLGALGGKNLPLKTNILNLNGFAAKTGKANFDISEWMLIRLLESLGRRRACVAMLCKTATARKVLKYAWNNHLPINQPSLHIIDAKTHFQVAVDACLLVVHTGVPDGSATAGVYRDISFHTRISTMGIYGKEMVSDMEEFEQLRDIDGESHYKWRSGVKHDAARVMEFVRHGTRLSNMAGEKADIEDAYLFPMLKSSDLANGAVAPKRFVLLTQRHPSDGTAGIQADAPSTWQYLLSHGAVLDARRSSIYRKRSRFAVFGVGDYTFSPWKVAISGLYKTLKFRTVGSVDGKPIVLDDTCCFIPCQTEQECEYICNLLNSDLCQRFLRSLVFRDAKRPVTIDILNRIDISRIAEKLGQEDECFKLLQTARRFENEQPLLVF